MEATELTIRSERTRADQHFCSIEYFDHEGEKVIRHAFLSAEEQKLLIEECARRGLEAKVHDLSPLPLEPNESVFSED
jgi:hypothetical protein